MRTDASGVFKYTAKKGAGRTLMFLYRGDATYHHSDASVLLRVPASATIKASRKTSRNGKSVTFSGKLLGRPFPPLGKLVDVQAFYRGRKWRAFATARTKPKGLALPLPRLGRRGARSSTVPGAGRADSAYPYELGYSKTVQVKVTG